MMIEIICEVCGKSFLREKRYIERYKHNYCSLSCSYEGKRKVHEKVCPLCGVSFITKDKRQTFCSHSHAQSYNNKQRYIEPRIEASCLACGKTFLQKKKKQMFCSPKCFGRYSKNKTLEMFLQGKLLDKQVRSNTVREYLLEKQENKCAICGNFPKHNGKSLVFVIDHIDGNFSNNIPENIRAICPNCNSQTDTFSGKNMSKNGVKRHKQYRS